MTQNGFCTGGIELAFTGEASGVILKYLSV